jgi:cell wall integrity and stress response component
MTEGSNCFCGDMLPAADTKVDDSKCDTPCDGYDQEMCKFLETPSMSFTRQY